MATESRRVIENHRVSLCETPILCGSQWAILKKTNSISFSPVNVIKDIAAYLTDQIK